MLVWWPSPTELLRGEADDGNEDNDVDHSKDPHLPSCMFFFSFPLFINNTYDKPL